MFFRIRSCFENVWRREKLLAWFWSQNNLATEFFYVRAILSHNKTLTMMPTRLSNYFLTLKTTTGSDELIIVDDNARIQLNYDATTPLCGNPASQSSKQQMASSRWETQSPSDSVSPLEIVNRCRMDRDNSNEYTTTSSRWATGSSDSKESLKSPLSSKRCLHWQISRVQPPSLENKITRSP